MASLLVPIRNYLSKIVFYKVKISKTSYINIVSDNQVLIHDLKEVFKKHGIDCLEIEKQKDDEIVLKYIEELIS